MIEFILIRGGDKLAPKIALASEWHYGTRSDYKPYAAPYMVDIHWEKYNWWDYMSKIKRWKPRIAMLPDFMNERQLPTLLMQHEELRQVVEVVACCPKFAGAIPLIPADCRIAISVPTSYSGYIPPLQQTNGRKCHLLGGSPRAQKALVHLIEGLGGTVVSADMNLHVFKGGLGQVFQFGRWIQRRSTEKRDELAILSGQEIKFWMRGGVGADQDRSGHED